MTQQNRNPEKTEEVSQATLFALDDPHCTACGLPRSFEPEPEPRGKTPEQEQKLAVTYAGCIK